MTRALYRDLDQAGIDSQLNLRARWPDHEDYLIRWARDSAAARASLDCGLDLAYGPTAGQTLDLFPAPGAPPAPLLAFIHGGYWQSLDKGDFSYLAPPFVAAGISFASINYDLAPGVGVTEIVAQIRRALAWLARNAPAHGFDPGRIFLAGHSAGGHLAMIAAATDWAAHGADLADDLVKGTCSVSGVYDLTPIRLSYQQPVLRLSVDEVADLSPLTNVPARAGPLVCAVGGDETAEFIRQQEALLAAWRARGLEARAVALPGRHHFSAVDALGEPDHALFAAVRAMVLNRPV